jgi:hypothetical protein
MKLCKDWHLQSREYTPQQWSIKAITGVLGILCLVVLNNSGAIFTVE